MPGGFVVRERLQRVLAGPPHLRDDAARVGEIASAQKVVRHLRGVLPGRCRMQSLQRVCRLEMELHSPRKRYRFIHHVAQEDMREPEASGAARHLGDDSLVDRRLEHREELGGG